MPTPADLFLIALSALGLALAVYNHWQLKKTEREWRERMIRRYGREK